MSDSEVILKITADATKVATEMARARKSVKDGAADMVSSMDRAKSSIGGLANGIKALGGMLAIGAAIRAVVTATMEEEAAVAQLNATLKSTGRLTPELSQALQEYAAALQRVTTYGDDTIVAMQALLLTFTRVGGDEFNRAQMAILDVATAMKVDLKTAALQVGKALNDPILGLTSLKKSGIQFSDAQQAMVKQLMSTGDVVGAQRVILSELETQFGGSARAARETLGGALAALKNAFGDLMEGKGGSIKGTTEALNELTDILQDPDTVKNIQTLTGALINGFGKVLTAVSETVEFTKWLSEEIASRAYGVANDDIIRLEMGLDEAKAKVRELEDAYKAVGWADKMLGKVGISQGFLDQIRGIESAREEVAKLQKQVDAYYESIRAKASPKKTGAPSVPTKTTPTGEVVDEEAIKKAKEEAARRKKAGDDAVAGLEREIALLGEKTNLEKILWELEKGKYAELSPAHKARIGALSEELEQKKQLLKVNDDAIEQMKKEVDEGTKLSEESMDRLAKAAARYSEETQTPLEKYKSTLEELNNLLSMGLISQETYGRAAQKALEDMGTTVDETKTAFNELQKTIEGWGQQSAQAIVDFCLTGKASFGDMIESMIADLLKMMLYQNITGPIAGAISSGIRGIFAPGGVMGGFTSGGATVAHSGGIPGVDSLPSRAAFMPANAPRFHSGLLPGEFAAILKKGEGVFTPGQMAALGAGIGGGNNVEINVINNNGSEVSTKTREANGGLQIDVMIDQAVAKKMGQFGSSSNKMLRQNYNAREKLVQR